MNLVKLFSKYKAKSHDLLLNKVLDGFALLTIVLLAYPYTANGTPLVKIDQMS